VRSMSSPMAGITRLLVSFDEDANVGAAPDSLASDRIEVINDDAIEEEPMFDPDHRGSDGSRLTRGRGEGSRRRKGDGSVRSVSDVLGSGRTRIRVDGVEPFVAGREGRA
jgi:hypothetical protein